MRPNTDLLPPLVHLGWKPLARLRPRTAREIGSSPWSIGLETIDRAYVDFAPLLPHLAALGATQARVQAGWARCEPGGDGVYQWDWLDEIVDGCLAHGIKPWLQTSYGNPVYSGGGGIGLGDGLPVSAAALAAWDSWVRAMAARYQGKVDTWEIWNEPAPSVVSADDYSRFFIRTATLLREVQPAARILGPGLADHDENDFIGKFLAMLAKENRTRLLDELTYHFYPHNPDEQFDCVEDLVRLCARHAPHVSLRQGETGSPSDCSRFLALGEFDWSERKQAAWNLRRLLAHHARGIPMNLFHLADMHYVKANGARFLGRNPKGLLCMFPDKTVAYPKPSYFAARHVFTVFDDSFPLAHLTPLPGRFLRRTSACAWQRRDEDRPSLICWWRTDAPPALTTPDLGLAGMTPHPLRNPVLIDFMSGHVFSPPSGIASGDETAWLALPWAETPLALAEKDRLALRPLA